MFYRERIETEDGAVAGLPAAVVAAGEHRRDFAEIFGKFGEDMAVKATRVECEKTRKLRCPLGDSCTVAYESHNLRAVIPEIRDKSSVGEKSEVFVFCPTQGPECEAMTSKTAAEVDQRLRDVTFAALNVSNLVFESSSEGVPLQLGLF